MANTDKMTVEIWSDIMCPFCYIGKRKFETALNSFKGNNNVEVVWHSFQLNPHMQYQPGKDVYTHLAEMKGFSKEKSMQLHNQLTATAKEVGLDYNFDIAVIANSFNAHRLIQFAKTHNKGDEMEERLFHAYFTEGKNTGDETTLVGLGEEIGLIAADITEMFEGNAFTNAVNEDIAEAQQIGVTGVPFFVFNRKYAVAGAQSPAVFVQVLEKSFGEWRTEHPVLQMEAIDGNTCTVDGNCN